MTRTGRLQRKRSIPLIKHAAERDASSELDFVLRGIVDWFGRRYMRAVELWRLGLDTVYADEAGGVLAPALIWYAGNRLGDLQLVEEGERLLHKYRLGDRAQQITFWPGPRGVVSFIFGEVDESRFLTGWTFNDNDLLEIRRRCRADFWIGVKANNSVKREAHFSAAVSNKHAILESEYFLAKWELSYGEGMPSEGAESYG